MNRIVDCPWCQGGTDGRGECFTCQSTGKLEVAKIVTTLSHSDEVSGTSIFEDGTRAYWTEGRSSSVKLRYPDGACRWYTHAWEQGNPYNNALSLDDYGNCREMTPQEEDEYDRERDSDD